LVVERFAVANNLPMSLKVMHSRSSYRFIPNRKRCVPIISVQWYAETCLSKIAIFVFDASLEGDWLRQNYRLVVMGQELWRCVWHITAGRDRYLAAHCARYT